MIIVAAGTGSRFENDKMMTPVEGRRLVEITVERVRPHVDRCVLVCRADQLPPIRDLDLKVDLAVGGPTRTTSEIAGLSSLKTTPDVIGIHDGARPNLNPALIEELFETARRIGGAVPVFPSHGMLVDRETLQPLNNLVTVQTPQVFRGPELIEAYRRAESERIVGHDTLEVVQRFSELEVATVDGVPTNIKVTYPEDLANVIPL